MTPQRDASPQAADAIDDPASWEPSRAFLKYSIAALLIGALSFGLALHLVAANSLLRSIGPLLGSAVALAAWFLLWRGRTRLAVNLLAIGAWVVVTGAAVFNGGVRTPVVITYPLIIIFVGWLIGARAALKLAGLTMATTAAFVLAEYQGWLPTPPSILALMYGVVQVLVTTLSIILITFLVRSYQTRLLELQRAGADLALRTALLEASQAELQRAQAVAKVGSWIYDIAGDSMRLSDETCRIFGLPRATVGSYASYLTRVPAHDRGPLEAAWLAARRSGSFAHEHRILVGKGIRWVRQTAEMVFAPDGSPLRAEGTVQDITQRRADHAALRDSEQRLQATFDAIPDLLFEVDLDGCYHDVHAPHGDLLAAPAPDLIGKRVSQVLPPEAAAVVLAELRLAHERGYATGGQFSLELAQGRRCFELSVARKAVLADEAPRFIVLSRDITEREKAAGKLRLLASVFTYAREGILITAADGAIIDVNAAFSRITGYAREEVLGRNPRMLGSGRQGLAFYTALWGDLLGQGHWYGELWNRRKGGEVYAQMQTISAVRDGSGAIVQYVALFSDITTLKNHENELEHIAHFDGLTGLPNRALLTDRLHQSMAQAQRRAQPLALVFLDLDGFKAINDRHGHEAGDQVLIHVAARMKQALREGDTLARFGGDEFVAVLLDLPDCQAGAPMLDRLLAAAAEPLSLAGQTLQVSASLGVSFYPQAQDLDADQLLRQADQAMYQAKLAGKNRFHAFNAGPHASIRA